MTASRLRTVRSLLKYTLLACAVYYIVVYLVVAFFRLQYPFELEWMEGATVDHVIRILSGQKIYVSPSLDFVPFLYTPLYIYFSALLSKIIGIGFLPLRLISFVSSLGCFYLIFLIVKKETDSNISGFLASSLFAATFRLSGAWFDIARVDSLFLLLLIGSLYIIKFKVSAKSYILAGILIALSFLTKQTALIISLPVMLYSILTNRRYSVYFIGTAAAIIGANTFIFNFIHDGWYNYFVFFLSLQHQILESMLIYFWTESILYPLSVAFVISVFYLIVQRMISNRKNYLFYLLITIGMLGGSWLSRLHTGGYDNVLMPAYASISIIFGLGKNKALE